MQKCALCERVELIKKREYPFLIKEFKHSYWVLGEHQYYQGYSILISKDHFREMHDMPFEVSRSVFEELTEVSSKLQKVFNPKKMNLCSLGNVVDHVHWHLFPRYEDDPHFFKPPWLQMEHFDEKKLTPDQAKKIISELIVKIS